MSDKWHTSDGKELTWEKTLSAMCDYYGTFCGWWHSNEFWKSTKSRIPNMSDEQSHSVIRDIERQADVDLWYWRTMQ